MIDLWLRNQGFVFDGRFWYAEFKGKAVKVDQLWIDQMLEKAQPIAVLQTLQRNLATWKFENGAT